MALTVRKFQLSDSFISSYETASVPWGPLGYVTFKRTYARRLDETTPGAQGTEEWYQTCRRVIEGMFTIQKEHCNRTGLPWSDSKAQRTAKEAYDRLFNMKWTPPGRGLWMMGTDYIYNKTAAGLFNCSFISTENIEEEGGSIFEWMMDALMLGIGVGFDTRGAENKSLMVVGPDDQETHHYTIPDTREGWANSVKVLVDSYLYGNPVVVFNYNSIRAEGEPIRGFGGTSSGPEPLKLLHTELRALWDANVGRPLTSLTILDTENYIGKCVVSGNVRRSAAICIGNPQDEDFLTAKNDMEALQDRRWGSNNSIFATVGMNYKRYAEQSQGNGEPGYFWLDNARKYSRMNGVVDNKDSRVMGSNPCAEITLENKELCNIVETYPARHDSYQDYLRTVKIAYLYNKTITLTNTHWPETNQVMLKNRRLGISQSGIVQAINRFGLSTMMKWNNDSYGYLEALDAKYSDWLCIPRSKKLTTVKPSGSVSLLNGSTPGIHFPESEYYVRRIRFSHTSDMLPTLIAAGHHVEPCVYSPNTMVVSFPVHEEYFQRGKQEVTLWEQMELAAKYQETWADNSVSITVTFKNHEAPDIERVLEHYENRLKCVSFLRYIDTGYQQAPYEPISVEQYNILSAGVVPVQRFGDLSQGGVGEKYCDGDKCEISFS